MEMFGINIEIWQTDYTLSEAWNGVNWADLMAAQGAFGTDFYDRTILRLKHRAYYHSDRPDIKIGPKGALGSHEIRSKPRTEYILIDQTRHHKRHAT